MEILNKIDDVFYYPVLIIVMAIAGIYFTLRTKGVQIRLFGEACKLIGDATSQCHETLRCKET